MESAACDASDGSRIGLTAVCTGYNSLFGALVAQIVWFGHTRDDCPQTTPRMLVRDLSHYWVHSTSCLGGAQHDRRLDKLSDGSRIGAGDAHGSSGHNGADGAVWCMPRMGLVQSTIRDSRVWRSRATLDTNLVAVPSSTALEWASVGRVELGDSVFHFPYFSISLFLRIFHASPPRIFQVCSETPKDDMLAGQCSFRRKVEW